MSLIEPWPALLQNLQINAHALIGRVEAEKGKPVSGQFFLLSSKQQKRFFPSWSISLSGVRYEQLWESSECFSPFRSNARQIFQ